MGDARDPILRLPRPGMPLLGGVALLGSAAVFLWAALTQPSIDRGAYVAIVLLAPAGTALIWRFVRADTVEVGPRSVAHHWGLFPRQTRTLPLSGLRVELRSLGRRRGQPKDSVPLPASIVLHPADGSRHEVLRITGWPRVHVDDVIAQLRRDVRAASLPTEWGPPGAESS